MAKRDESGGLWHPALGTWYHVLVSPRQILRGTWRNVPDSGKGERWELRRRNK